MDEDGASLPERDLFTAAEIVGLRPLAGGPGYLQFIEANAWVAERFPNFFWMRRDRAPLPFETSRPGLFAVGDVRSGSTKRVAAAVGEGSAAVRSVHDCLAFDRHA